MIRKILTIFMVLLSVAGCSSGAKIAGSYKKPRMQEFIKIKDKEICYSFNDNDDECYSYTSGGKGKITIKDYYGEQMSCTYEFYDTVIEFDDMCGEFEGQWEKR